MAPTSASTLEPGPEDRELPVVDYRFEQHRYLGWIQLEICVLNHDDVAGRSFESGAHGATFAPCLFLQHDNQLGPGGKVEQRISRPVGGRAIYYDYLLRHAAIYRPHTLKERNDRVSLIPDRDDYRKLQCSRTSAARAASSSCSIRSIASHVPANGYAPTMWPDAAALFRRSGISNARPSGTSSSADQRNT